MEWLVDREFVSCGVVCLSDEQKVLGEACVISE
jgi:hypothetical protein